ncbi:MAG: hypothetical protein L6R45_33815 [Anaerolineae bacterium]|nr:hypothetical protein [Anaerolineae bacterium]
MGTMPLKELLKLWELAKMPVEMVIGHILQHLAKMQTAIDAMNGILHHIRADVDYLAAHNGVDLPSKGKKKLPKQG